MKIYGDFKYLSMTFCWSFYDFLLVNDSFQQTKSHRVFYMTIDKMVILRYNVLWEVFSNE